jgi:hypothetical protein
MVHGWILRPSGLGQKTSSLVTLRQHEYWHTMPILLEFGVSNLGKSCTSIQVSFLKNWFGFGSEPRRYVYRFFFSNLASVDSKVFR